MSEYIVTVIDTTGIQPYIFGSNKLRENIGASFLTSQATKQWVKKTLDDLGKPYYFPDPEWGQYDPDATPYIEQSGIIAEVVYAGGGNAVLLFKASDGDDYSKQFARSLSKRVLKDAPGINLVVAHSQKFTWDYSSNSLCKRIQKLIENEITQAKRERVPSSPLLGLGVTADCRSTRLVAVDTSDRFMDVDEGEGYLISNEVKQKLEAVKGANARLAKIFTGAFNQDVYEFPYRFDHLGRSSGDSSYLAVVHIDGNGMGDRFRQCGESASSDREYIKKMRELSWSVQTIAMDALRSLGKLLSESVTFEQGNPVIKSFGCKERLIDEIPLKVADNDKKIYLPFRPLVYGGDDVTFVCDGRLGLTLATLFLKNFEKIAADGKKLTACAGVSIVKAHYPFARAYELSESLCGSAKKFKKDQDSDTSAIDWHIAASGLLGDLGEIRKREYLVPNGDLTVRPLYLNADSDHWRNWEDFQRVVTELNTHDNWCDRRNKVIALREILRQGETATEQFLGAYGLPDLPAFTISDNDLKRKGWTNDTRKNQGKKEDIRVCGYFDAIEALEFYLPLTGGES
jgi:hypothetical protein